MKANDSKIHLCTLLLACLLLLGLNPTAVLAQTCEGCVCLKNGSRLLYAGDDRMEMPRKNRDVEVYRNFLSRDCQHDIVPVDRVDSVLVWNSSAPDVVRVLVPVPGVGWSWLYASHPRLQVYVYASQGYSLSAMGGMKAWQGQKFIQAFFIPSKTACDFYVQRPGGKTVCLGDTYKKCDKSFVRRLCQYVGLSAEVEKQLLASDETNRSTVIQRVLELMDEEHKDHKQTISNENNQTLAAAYTGSAVASGRTGEAQR